MAIPNEFTEAAVAAGSEKIETPYRDFVTSAEPYRSLLEKNPWLVPPKSGESLIWNEGRYYDTTIGRKHHYWRDQDLPAPTKNIHQLRADFNLWGYCLIEEATSVEQTKVLYDRVREQAAAES